MRGTPDIALLLIVACIGCWERQIDLAVLPDAGTAGDAGADAGTGPGFGPLVVKTKASPDCAVIGIAEVSCPGASSVTVEYGETTAYGMKTPQFAVGADGGVTVPLLGLKHNALNHLKVTATAASGETVVSTDRMISSPDLPPGFPRFVVTKRTGPADGYLLLGTTTQWGAEAKAIMVSREGRVMWYRLMEKMSPHGLEVSRLPNGNIAVYMGMDRGFDEVDLAGTTVRTWRDTVAERGTNGHEFRTLSNGHVLLLGYGGLPNEDNYDFVDEIDEKGGGYFHWAGPAMKSENDVYHPNSLDPTPDGAVLLSLRNTSEVLKIDMGTGRTLWTLGGAKSDFTFVNDPLNGPSQQHHVRRLPNGNLTIFDNGVMRNTPVSRAVEYAIDETARTATLVWENYHDPKVFCPIAGSMERLGNGNTIVCWGSSKIDTGDLYMTEVAPDGTVVWEMKSPGYASYRAEYSPTAYP